MPPLDEVAALFIATLIVVCLINLAINRKT